MGEARRAQAAVPELGLRAAGAWLELTKPRITLLVVLTAAAGFALARGPRPADIGWMVLGTALLAAGIFALNQVLERDLDRRMTRTGSRPIPSGLVDPRHALALGAGLCAGALAVLALALPPLSAAVGAFTLVTYLFVYTPLKRVTPWHTAIGALPGATPPLLGWAAATGSLPRDAWLLAAIVFLWQFPHFIAIETIYRDDYKKAGFRVVPVEDGGGLLTKLHLLVPLVLLVPVGALPALTLPARPACFAATLALGAAFLAAGLWAGAGKGAGAAARLLLRASILYLPLVFGLFVALRV
jgi:heme o synthase